MSEINNQLNNESICPRCGSTNKAGVNFCGGCGDSIRQISSDSIQQAPSDSIQQTPSIQQSHSDQINQTFENPSLLLGKPLLYWALMIPLGLVNGLLLLFGGFVIIEYFRDPSGGDFLPNVFLLIVGGIVIGLSYPGIMGLRQFHKGEPESKPVLFYELVVIGILSFATVVGAVIAVLLIFYLNSDHFDRYIEFVKHKKMNQWTYAQKSAL